MTRILWVLGNRLRETRIRLVASRYEEEALAIRALLEQSASQLSVKSPLHKLPIYLESRLTLSDAFQTLEVLRKHGDAFEASLARMCLEILENVRKELEIYRRLQQIYEAVCEAPEDATPEEVRGRCCVEFRKLFKQVDHMIEGEKNLPRESGHIFIMNHIVNHPDNTLPNDFQLTLDTHFVSCMLLSRKYGEPPVRVVRKSHPEEYGHQKYFDRLGYIYVYAKHVDEDKQNPKLLAEQRRRAFFETAARYLRDGKNLMICPEGTCTVTERSPLPLKAGAFRLATFVEPEPLIVPVVVANFDRKITRTTLIAQRARTVSSSQITSRSRFRTTRSIAFIADSGSGCAPGCATRASGPRRVLHVDRARSWFCPAPCAATAKPKCCQHEYKLFNINGSLPCMESHHGMVCDRRPFS